MRRSCILFLAIIYDVGINRAFFGVDQIIDHLNAAAVLLSW